MEKLFLENDELIWYDMFVENVMGVCFGKWKKNKFNNFGFCYFDKD